MPGGSDPPSVPWRSPSAVWTSWSSPPGWARTSPELRAAVCRGLECLGLRIDDELNAACRPDADIAAPGLTARILVIHTREELMIARETRRMAPTPDTFASASHPWIRSRAPDVDVIR
jgi:hypothetical protein